MQENASKGKRATAMRVLLFFSRGRGYFLAFLLALSVLLCWAPRGGGARGMRAPRPRGVSPGGRPAPLAIPPHVHYVFGMDSNFGHLGFGLVHYLSLLATKMYLNPPAISWHHRFLPPNSSAWWACARPLVTPRPVDDVTAVHGRAFPSLHVAHKADIVRLDVLRAEGGVYLDSDVIPLRSFDELLRLGADGAVVMGREEAPGQSGLANAVMLAPPNATFLNRWWARYDDFNPEKSWARHSVILPRELAREHPREVVSLGGSAFFAPVWTELKALYEEDDGFSYADNFAVHLWTSQETKRYGGLAKLSVASVFEGGGSFHRVARRLLRDADARGLLCDAAKPLPPLRAGEPPGGSEWGERRRWGGSRGEGGLSLGRG